MGTLILNIGNYNHNGQDVATLKYRSLERTTRLYAGS